MGVTISTPEKAPKQPPGSGQNLPELRQVSWERDRDGAIEAWHTPPGVTHRNGKTYLGRLGKRRLAELDKLPTDDRRQVVADWIREKRTGKGITP